MAVFSLTDTQSCTDFFQCRILVNLQYWRDCAPIEAIDIPTLDQERDGIIRAISFALDLGEAWPLVYELITALSPYMERRGYWDIWHRILNRAVEVAQRVGDTSEIVQLLLMLARLLQRQGRFKLAIVRYRQIIRLARQVGDVCNEALACNNLGYFYIEQGYWHRAEVLCCYALTIFEQIDSDHGRAHTENHLGILYTRQGRWTVAQQHLERACAIWQSMDDDHGLMRGYINLGMLYVDMECASRALPCLEKALHQAELTGEEIEIAKVYINMGIAYRLNGEPAKAEMYAWQAEAIFRRFSEAMGLAWAHGDLGLAYLDQGKWPEAKLHLATALQAWRNLANKYWEIMILTYMVEYDLARDNPLQAARQLTEVECLIDQYGQNRHAPPWQSLLLKYRRNLAEYSTRQVTAD